MSKIIELAKKLKALAEQGVGGEKINAQKMLADLCEKHSINPAKLDEVKRADYWFQATGNTDTLMNHIIWKVCGPKTQIHGHRHKKYGGFAKVSEGEKLEILGYYAVYSRALKQALKDLETAFIWKNNIYSDEPDEDTEPSKSLTAAEKAEAFRISQLMGGLEHTPVFKQLGEGTK